jgi:2-keto-4-pentenoate hydratase/2-oxohepta-3-ene-1,7-dioic acid hydratase in catechol pathway
MRVIRYASQREFRYGEVRGHQVYPFKGTIGSLTPSNEPAVALDQLRLVAPVTPRQIIAIGPGYRAHLKGGPEPARPYYWIKPASAVLDPEGVIELPPGVPVVCHESELAVVIGKVAKDVPLDRAQEYIFGYTCINDVTAGNLPNLPEFLASQFFVDGKIYDTFAPLGPWIETTLSTQDLGVECRVNGTIRQKHRTSDFIFSPAKLVSLISSVLTLHPGDVIATGSPPGVGPLTDGDVVEVEVEGIGILRNRVKNKATRN